MKVKFWLVTALIVIVSVNAFAQRPGREMKEELRKMREGIIAGRIVDQETNEPLSFANVYLYSMRNDSLISGAIAEKDGNFEMKDLPFGRFNIQVKYVGYEVKKIEDIRVLPRSKTVELGDIGLAVSSAVKDEITVTGEKERIEFKADRKIVNISNDLSASGGSAVEALENVPSVEVDIEGNVTLRGSSNFKVFIDGKPSVLEGSDALQQIPATAIDHIEIITNPSAKYDPDGAAGIINVVMKENEELKLSGVFNAMAGIRDKYKVDLLLNWNPGNFRITAGGYFNNYNFFGDRSTYRETYRSDTTNILSNTGDVQFRRFGYNFKGGIGYDFSRKFSMNLEGNYGIMEFTRDATGHLTQSNNPGDLKLYYYDKSIMSHDRDYYRASLDGTYKFAGESHKLFSSLYFSSRNGEGKDSQYQNLTNEDWEKIAADPDRIRSFEDGVDDNFRWQLDYTNKHNETTKVEAGLQTRIDNDIEDFIFENYQPQQNNWVINDQFSNEMDFRRDIYSAYALYGSDIYGINYQLGLRGEYTYRKIALKKAGNDYIIDRIDIFPSAHLSRQFSKTDQILASYSRRIDRPRGRWLDPSPSFADNYNYRKGNPELEPEYIDSYELGYQKSFNKSFIALEGYYRMTKNRINRISTLENDSVMMHTAANLDRDHSIGAELMLNSRLMKILNLNISGTYYYYKIEGGIIEEDIQTSTNTWRLRTNISIDITKTTKVQLDGFYRGPSISSQGKREGMGGFNVSLRQNFLDNNASLTLRTRDILGTMERNFTSSGTGFTSHHIFSREAQVFMLTFSYRFNDYKDRKRQRGEDMEDDDIYIDY